MLIRYGFDIRLSLSQPVLVTTLMDVHPSRRSQIVHETDFSTEPRCDVQVVTDAFGNIARRFVAPAGVVSLTSVGIVRDSGRPETLPLNTPAADLSRLPADVSLYLQGSRYCETDLLSQFAWDNFGDLPRGGAQVQAICDYVNGHLRFDYGLAYSTRTAVDAMREGTGVCRDFTHLAIALCRALNIPARYCNGYLGDIGVPPDTAPMDFNAWFEVYLEGGWHTFDARHNMPRIGRILISRGRDAADTAMITTFGPHCLTHFEVFTDEIKVLESVPTVKPMSERINAA
jgi:transglutaminase-like putative cysteine protease